MLQGGTGAGTVIRFALTLAGRRQEIEARVEEPEPGRVLSEAYPERSAVTRFTVDPTGDQSQVRIETSWESSRGLAGLIERLVAPRLFRKLYTEELDLIERWAIEQSIFPDWLRLSAISDSIPRDRWPGWECRRSSRPDA